MAEVRLERLHKRIGKAEIIPDLSLTIREGEFFTLVGPSGCGKSTLLHLIAGLDMPTAGRILFDGRDVTRLAPRERDVALVFQTYALYPHMTVEENLAFPLRVSPRPGRLDRPAIGHEVRRVAGLLGLEPLLERRPKELSGGQRQRVALGRAIIRKPRVFLLDEPLSNLDAQLRAGMRAELRRLHDELRITTIYVTHDQTEAMALADRLAVLDHGRVQHVGTSQDAYERPHNVFVATFLGHPPMNLLDARIESGAAVAGPIRMSLPMPVSSGGDGRRIKLGVRPEEVRVRAPDALAPPPGHRELVGATVRLVEPASGQIWVTCAVDQGPRVAQKKDEQAILIGLAERPFKSRPGDRVTLLLDGAVAHVFDAETGRRLEDSAGVTKLT